jgi:hypothetical protein
MKKNKIMRNMFLLAALTALAFAVGCSSSSSGASGDTTAPTVTSMIPLDTSTGVPLNTSINATFDKAMNPATMIGANFTVAAGTTPVAGTVTYDATNMALTFAQTSNLAVNTVYTATITTGAKDTSGNALAAAMVYTFTTGTAVDTTAPTVLLTVPLSAATGASVTDSITATFSKGMNPATIVAANFTVMAGTTAVPGKVTYDIPNKAVVFAPTTALGWGTPYTATITTGVKDTAGHALAANYVWTFTTSGEGSGPAPVVLGTAGNFVVLAKTAISTVPASKITGDIGISPAAESFMTGFSQTKATGYSTSPQVTGSMYAADQTPPTPSKMTTAISDMATAYTDAAGRSANAILNIGTGNLGGLVLTPGLYKWTSSVTIPTNVTIQGGGGSSDVWIFQISGNLAESNSVNVFLTSGAQAKNIFWQVAGTTTIGTNAVFNGIILDQTSITIQNKATFNGRALAQTLVAMDQATVTKP